MVNVRQFRPKEASNSEQNNGELRHLALQIAAMLPYERDDALRVLDIAREVVSEFLLG